MKQRISITLAAALILTSPGGFATRAFAQVAVAATGAKVAVVPGAAGAALGRAPLAGAGQSFANSSRFGLSSQLPSAGLLPRTGVAATLGQPTLPSVSPAAVPSALRSPEAVSLYTVPGSRETGVQTSDEKSKPTAAARKTAARLSGNAALSAISRGAAPGRAAALGRVFDFTAGRAEDRTGDAVGASFQGRALPGLRPASVSRKDEGAADSKVPSAEGRVDPESHPELFRPRSSRSGIGAVTYVFWNARYKIMQWLNLKLSRDPNRRVSWDKWPTVFGLLYLLAKIRYLRSGVLTDPYDDAANDNRKKGPEPAAARIGHTADGSWVSDRENPQMGAANTRFGSNIPPKKVRPDVENMTPSSREVGKLRWRPVDPETGKARVQPALILNDMAGGWIQFQFHGFGGNTKRHPVSENPHRMPRSPGDNESWPEKEALVDRTVKDPTRVAHDGRVTPINERTHAWIQAQIYGTNEGEQHALRSHEGGKMRLDKNGNLPEDPNKPGVDQTGFNNNYNPQLSFLHWIFTVEHNAIADHYRYFHPDWDDERLFMMARKVNVAQMARIHTIQWTEDLLQHPTLQAGMHADWYGFLGMRLKNYLMRLSYRRPFIGRLIRPILANDTISGMPGSKWEHHDGPFQVPKQFRLVYRLHEMVLDDHEFFEPGTDRRLDQKKLLDIVHGKTRGVVESLGYDVLGYSFARKSAGALTLHNFPRALTHFENQQDGQMTDLAERDTLRERTDGTGTYNEFRKSVGEPPVKDFMELTGGNKELADEISRVYGGDIERVDAGIGILAEPKPAGFALSFTQFYQFVLNAPRRVKSNRHLTEQFTLKDYEPEGMSWVEHGGGMGGVMARHLKDKPYGKQVLAAMEGVTRWFAPWPDTETFPLRMLEAADKTSSEILMSNWRTLAFGAAAGVAAVLSGAASWQIAAGLTAALALPALLYLKRMLAWRFMQKTWQSVYTDRRVTLFPTLYKGETWAYRSAALGRFAALAVLGAYGTLAWTLIAANPLAAAFTAGTTLAALGLLWAARKLGEFAGTGGLRLALAGFGAASGWLAYGAIAANPAFAMTTAIAALAAAAALSSVPTLLLNTRHAREMETLKIALLSRMREGGPPATKASEVPGDTALEKRYWFLVPPGAKAPVARFGRTYLALREHGQTAARAFTTAFLSHLLFGPKTRRGLTLRQKWDAGILFSPFAIYVPHLFRARGYSNTRIYAREGDAKGLKPGEVDMEEFDRMFRLYAPGREFMTVYDMSRMIEGNSLRDAREGRGGRWSRFVGRVAAAERAKQLIGLYADKVVEEDRKLVPAISRELLLRVYQGTAQLDILKERARDGVHPDLTGPAPVKWGAPLPEAGFKGTAAGLKGRDVMSLLLKRDPNDENAYYATLSEYTRLKIPTPERLQITKWVPRMYAYRVEHAGGADYLMRPLRVSEDGEIVPDPEAPVSELKLKMPGTLRGAVMTRKDAGTADETIAFKAGVGSTWEEYVPGKFFRSEDSEGGDYFHKNYNTVLGPDGVIEFLPQAVKVKSGLVQRFLRRLAGLFRGKGAKPEPSRIEGKFEIVEKIPGLFVLKPKGSGHKGADKLAGRIGVFIDIVNWKPVARTNELLLINPDDAKDVGFFYERH